VGGNLRAEIVTENGSGKVPTVDQASGVEDLVVLQYLLLLGEFIPCLVVARVHPALAFIDLEEFVPKSGNK
jgi:hypothetical protein